MDKPTSQTSMPRKQKTLFEGLKCKLTCCVRDWNNAHSYRPWPRFQQTEPQPE